MGAVGIPKRDLESNKPLPDGLLGGNNFIGNLGDRMAFHHVFLVEEILVIVQRLVNKFRLYNRLQWRNI